MTVDDHVRIGNLVRGMKQRLVPASFIDEDVDKGLSLLVLFCLT